MSQDPNAVIQSRDITIWQKDYAAAAALPANTVAAGASWAGFNKRAWTDGGAGWSAEQSFTGVSVDQVPDPLYYIYASRNLTFTAAFAEQDTDTIQLATGMGGSIITPGDEDTLGQEELKIGTGTSPEINTWGLDIPQPINGLPFRILVPRGQSTGGVTSNISPTQKGLVNLIVQALPDTSFSPTLLMVVRRVTPFVA